MSGWWNIPVYGALLGLLYHQAIAYLFSMWRREDFTYGYAIVPIVLYLLWEKRAELKRHLSVPSWRGRILTNMFQLKAYAFWDALTRRRTDGALVRLITPVYETEQLSDAETRLQAFTRDLVPVLDRFLPGKE